MNSIYQQIFNKAADGIIVISPSEDSIVFCNSKAKEILQIDSESNRVDKVSEVFRNCLPFLTVLTQEVIERKQAWSHQLKAVGLSSQLIDLEVSASLLSENPIKILFCIRDKLFIDKQRETFDIEQIHRSGLQKWKNIQAFFEEFEQRNQLILQAVGEGIYGIDSLGKLTFINKAAEKMIGWNGQDIIGKSMHAVIHHSRSDGSDYMVKECHIYAALKLGRVQRVNDETFWHKDGYAFPIEYVSTPIIQNNQILGAVVVFRDISARKQAEAKVEKLKTQLELENAYLKEEYKDEHHFVHIIGKSLGVKKIHEQILMVSPTDAIVLITGESGTGKELIARAIHENSKRKNRPMIRVNCASIPKELFESEFFGHVKGAFTGALKDRIGRFELADGGSIFLDEVGEIPIDLQSKLLRVLQEQQFERVGESKTRKIDVRIIAATNKNLSEEVRRNTFREDLFYRLNVFPIELPPLRKRKEDLPLLVQHFLDLIKKKYQKHDVNLRIKDMQLIEKYSWPGNIRELIHVIERAVILSKNGRLILNLSQNDTIDSPEYENHNDVAVEIKTQAELVEEEKKNLIRALQIAKGKVFGDNSASQLLQINPTTLNSKLKKYQINRLDFINNRIK